ncbi:MAG TPA: hypothetical protein VHI72_13570 [Hyphomicrobiaceae bacterium]|nr:hypothetical protein [Hyphomicrobiaceae bacterium]
MVYEAAQTAFLEDRAFSAVLAADQRVSAHLGIHAIDKLLDPLAYTGLCSAMAKEAVTRARNLALALGGGE